MRSRNQMFFTFSTNKPTQRKAILTISLEKLIKKTEKAINIYTESIEFEGPSLFLQRIGTHQLSLQEYQITTFSIASELANSILTIVKSRELSQEEYDAYMGVISLTDLAISDVSSVAKTTIDKIEEYSKNYALNQGIQDHLKILRGVLMGLFGIGLITTSISIGWVCFLPALVGVCYFCYGCSMIAKNVSPLTIPANYAADLHQNLSVLSSARR